MTLELSGIFLYDTCMKRIVFTRLLLVLCLSMPIASHALKDMNKELIYRVQFSQAEDIKLLLERGGDPNITTRTGMPLVSVAALRKDDGAVAVMRALVEAGANVNEGGRNKEYPIIIAARENNTAMMRYLIEEAGADYMVENRDGLTPLEIAEYYGYHDSLALLRARTETRVQEHHWRSSDEHRDLLYQELGLAFCEHQYMSYYFSSGQGGESKAEQRRTLNALQSRVRAVMADLNAHFQARPRVMDSMKTLITDKLMKEFNEMVSNRQRRQTGVGTEKDVLRRCNRLSSNWFSQLSLDDPYY